MWVPQDRGREKRRRLPTASTRDFCPGLAALPRPLQGFLCWSGCYIRGYQARPAPVVFVLLGDAKERPRLQEDPATERSSVMCHVTPTSPENCGDMWVCASGNQTGWCQVLSQEVLSLIQIWWLRPKQASPNLSQLCLVCKWNKIQPPPFPGTHCLPSFPRIERGWPLLLQRQGYCPRITWTAWQSMLSTGRKGAAHVMTVSTKAHLCGLHKHSFFHLSI